MANEYISLDFYKDRANIPDDQDDALLESVIEAVSRFIDQQTWRRFYSTNETRYYTAQESGVIEVDDITSVDALKTDSGADRTYATTWQTTDYDLMPANAALNGEPYTEIHTTPNGDYAFPIGLVKGVEIKGDFGFIDSAADTPSGIVEATTLGVNRVLARLKTPLGVSASPQVGQMKVEVRQLKADPDFMDIISPFERKA